MHGGPAHSQDLLQTRWCDTAHIHGSMSHGYFSCNTILGYIMPDWCVCISVFHSTICLIHLYVYLYLYFHRLLKALLAISKTLSACVALSPCNSCKNSYFQLVYSLVRRDFCLMLQRMLLHNSSSRFVAFLVSPPLLPLSVTPLAHVLPFSSWFCMFIKSKRASRFS